LFYGIPSWLSNGGKCGSLAMSSIWRFTWNIMKLAKTLRAQVTAYWMHNADKV